MVLSDDAHQLIGVLAYVYLQNNRPDRAEILLQALRITGHANTQDLTTLALSSLRAGKPEASLETLDALAMQGEVGAPFHLIRAQALNAVHRRSEAQAAMRAYVESRSAAEQNERPVVGLSAQ